MTSRKPVERYPLIRSPLYRVGRAKDLAAALNLTPKRMTSLIVRRSALYLFRDEVIGGKARSLAVPIAEMRIVHDRIKNLLGRVILPDYLFSPRRGKTAVDNALVHQGAAVVTKLDIKQFYPSTTSEHVFQFFRHRLGMVDDVAGRLTKICTINDKVPFGSPLSPILCALVHDDLFSQISTRCQLNGDTLSLWVDDLTVSGESISKSLVHDIERLIAAKGLKSHKAHRSTGARGIVITGTFIGPNGPAPANKSHLKLRDKLSELKVATDLQAKAKITESLLGMVNHQMTVYPQGSEHHTRLTKRRQWLWSKFKSIRAALTDSTPKLIDEANKTDEPTVPWE